MRRRGIKLQENGKGTYLNGYYDEYATDDDVNDVR